MLLLTLRSGLISTARLLLYEGSLSARAMSRRPFSSLCAVSSTPPHRVPDCFLFHHSCPPVGWFVELHCAAHAARQRRRSCTREFPAQRRSSLTACRVLNAATRVVWIRSATTRASLAVGPRQSVEKVRPVHVLSQPGLQLPGPWPLDGRPGQREGGGLPARHPQTALQLPDIPCPKPRCHGSPSHRGLPVSTLPHLDASMKPRLIRAFRIAPEHPTVRVQPVLPTHRRCLGE